MSPTSSKTALAEQNSFSQKTGFFGIYGGSFVSEDIQKRLDAISKEYELAKNDPTFVKELEYYLTHYSGRETPLFFCKNLTKRYKGAKIYLKREDLNHLGAHKINNSLGQVLLAKRMGIKKLICETGAGQHGVATAAAAALFGLSCVVYMGEEDVKRQQPNVFRMQLMGATVIPVLSGQRTLKEAVDATFTAFATDEETFYVVGSAVGPHPYPTIVRDFQSVIGNEAKKQCLAQEGRLPDICIACIGGGSNAIGLFHPFIEDKKVQLIGVEPGGIGTKLGEHAAALSYGKPGVLHGSSVYVLEDEKGETALVHSISAGLDYPASGPEHGFLKDTNRATYVTVTDDEAVAAFAELSRHEGIIPALESSHALAYAFTIAPTLSSDTIIIVNLSGRGDKDIPQLQKYFKL